jgi:hypothetical protein
MMFDPESLMFSLPWDEIEAAFVHAANQAGYYGADVYKFSWDLGTYKPSPEMQMIFDTANELAYNAGRSIAKLYEEANEENLN